MSHKVKMSFFIVMLIMNIILIVTSSHPPQQWISRIEGSQMMYSPGASEAHLMPYVGNGYVATQIESDSIFVGGVYNGPALSQSSPSHRARIPNLFNFQVQGSVIADSALDVDRAIFYRRVEIQGGVLEQRWYAHGLYRNLLVYELYPVELSGDQTARVCLNQFVGESSADVQFKQVETSFGIAWIGETLVPELSKSETTGVVVVFNKNETCFDLSIHDKYTFLAVFNTTLESSNPLTQILEDTQKSYAYYKALSTYTTTMYKDIPFDNLLLDQHIQYWNALNMAGIEVQGSTVSRAINASLYYIKSSVREDWPYSLSPGSLSSNSYNGHVFWDCETWMYPTLLYLYPSIASGNLLRYRVNRVQEAREKALSYHSKLYTGAMFPWESAFTGAETCPTDAPTGQLEQHISGDIVFAIKQYYRSQVASNSITDIAGQEFLKTYAPLVLGVADFYASRATPRPHSPPMYDINGVIPPDEYAVNVNNSIYTNAIAQISLDFALEMINTFNLSVPADTLQRYRQVSANIYIPFDANKQIHLEYEGYSGQTIKQADVVLLKYPLSWSGYQSSPRQVVENDLVYYEQRTDSNGPAMTYGMYAIGWIELGDYDRAKSLFLKSYANVHEPYLVWSETPSGGAVNFITGAGGFLQTVLNGYGGLRILDPSKDSPVLFKNAILFDPVLLPDSTFVKFRRVHFQGALLDLGYNSTHVTLCDSSTTKDRPPLYTMDPSGTINRLYPLMNYIFKRGKLHIFEK